MTGEPFVLDRAENPHPRMRAEALRLHSVWSDAIARAHFSGSFPDQLAMIEAAAKWDGYLACMCDATGEEPDAIRRWLGI